MARAHFVQSARKDNPVAKKGESYWWWKFRHGGKRYSKERPRPSQLTQSAYFSSLRELVERIEDAEIASPEEMESFAGEIAEELRSIGDQCQESLDNMPESLQSSPTGELLQERIDACEQACDTIESISDDFEFEMDEDSDDDRDEQWAEQFEEWRSDKADEMTEALGECEI